MFGCTARKLVAWKNSGKPQQTKSFDFISLMKRKFFVWKKFERKNYKILWTLKVHFLMLITKTFREWISFYLLRFVDSWEFSFELFFRLLFDEFNLNTELNGTWYFINLLSCTGGSCFKFFPGFSRGRRNVKKVFTVHEKISLNSQIELEAWNVWLKAVVEKFIKPKLKARKKWKTCKSLFVKAQQGTFAYFGNWWFSDKYNKTFVRRSRPKNKNHVFAICSAQSNGARTSSIQILPWLEKVYINAWRTIADIIIANYKLKFLLNNTENSHRARTEKFSR